MRGVRDARTSVDPPTLTNDASLNDVGFVDAEIGWAVGARGTILSTVDGGQTWTAQEIPGAKVGHINALHMIDTENGWAVANDGVILRYGIPEVENAGT